MKHYHIRRDENRKCDDCGADTLVQFFRDGFGWQTLGSVSFAVQPNLSFLKRFRRWCEKCKKPMEIRYRTLRDKP